MKTRRNHRKAIGLILLIVSIVLSLMIAFGSTIIDKTEASIKQLQQSVLKTEKEIQDIIQTNPDHSQYAKKGLGLYVFQNDSLLFWNNNAVGPKLIRRKIKIGNDTICNLLTGDYYVKSFQHGQLNYYVFKLLNSTYQLENQYFNNGIVPFNTFFDGNIEFGANEGSVIQSSQGKPLTICAVRKKAQLKTPYRQIIIAIAILSFFIGMAMLLSKQKKAQKKKTKFKIEYGIACIIVIALLLTYLFYEQSRKNENKNMVQLAEKLLEKRDLDFEASYDSFAKQVKNDSVFQNMIFAESNVLADVIIGYSKELVFDETMKAYITSLTLCAPEDEIAIEPEGYITNCDDYFLEKLAKNNQKRVGDGLYFIDYNTLDPNYLGKIKVYSNDSLQFRTLYFEFYKPLAPEGFSFPQLLQESESQKMYDYSVANYRDQVLVYKYGRYIYPNFLNNLDVKDHVFTFENNFKHYTIQRENNSIIISTPRKGWSEITAPFALIFIGLLLPYLFIYWVISPKNTNRNKKRSFRQRLQTVVISTLAISFLAIGPVSVIYMRSLYNKKTAASQYETTRTLALEMRNNIDFENLLGNASRDTWNEILQHYSSTFFTDLNLYSLDGKLIATTRQEIYELTLQAPIMNAEAYQNMHNKKALYYTHKEQLGRGTYESAYIPINDINGNTLTYLNTPYFSSETDLHKEILYFVLTYINIILVLLSIALVLVLGITNKLTRPLALIQSKMGNIKFDQKNEPIEWKGNDEIGALVKQYNQLIVELEKSAAELKRTTTESAWRGVARQVAHEIKNSLTPMRLSVQMLQRNIENGKATPEQTQRTANTLIEQIDALSDIASSFSRYAKLPENHPQPLDLAELVGNVVNLYDNTENIIFIYDYDKTKNHTYNGDKTNLNSAVGNLIKNATQAIGSKPEGKIEVSLQSTETTFAIIVKDNGKGIKDEDKDQIFLPNFTTKTGGSGVGLSLTYNIVQSAGGTISFESREGEGAKFVIELPKS